MADIATVAAEHFAAGYNCSQSVLLAFCSPLGLEPALAVRLATGFGTGMGRGANCGAVSGAIMALGLFGGGGGPEGKAAKMATYARGKVFYEQFAALHGSLICCDLLGLDPSTPQGLEQARREGRFQTICSGLVRDAARIVQELLTSARADGA